MRTLNPIIISAAIACAAWTSAASAQPGGAGRPVPPPLAGSLSAPAPDASSMQPVAEGKVQRLLINPFGEVDGLRLADATLVKFPPHMGEALATVVQPGQTARVLGHVRYAGSVHADAVVNVDTGRTVIHQPPVPGATTAMAPHLRAQALQTLQVEGRIEAVLAGPRGEANGVLLSDGSIVRFPPGSVRAALQAGLPFAASGMGTRNQYGQAIEAVSVGSSASSLQPLGTSLR